MKAFKPHATDSSEEITLSTFKYNAVVRGVGTHGELSAFILDFRAAQRDSNTLRTFDAWREEYETWAKPRREDFETWAAKTRPTGGK